VYPFGDPLHDTVTPFYSYKTAGRGQGVGMPNRKKETFLGDVRCYEDEVT